MPVHYQQDGPVVTITIDRPERRNAVNRATADALLEAWLRFDADDSASVGILTGAGGHFSAGADLKDFDLIDRPEGFLGFTRLEITKPTIAAVAGFCVAGGLEMALWCDLRIAGADAVFGCFERTWGVPLVDGGTQRLPRIVGMGRALEMILTGRAVPAQEAYSIGLANRVVEEGTHLNAAVEIAKQIASFPQETVRSDRAAVLGGFEFASGLDLERRLGIDVLTTAAEGAAAYRESRRNKGPT